MARTRVTFAAGFEEQLDLAVRPQLVAKAEAAATVSRQVARDRRRTGDLERSISVDGTRLQSDDPGIWAIELGKMHMDPIAPLRKGAESTGARLV